MRLRKYTFLLTTLAYMLACSSPQKEVKVTSKTTLTQAQVDSARGDATTVLPPGLRHPTHWDRLAHGN